VWIADGRRRNEKSTGFADAFLFIASDRDALKA
jgi:hypothetical protein